MDAGWYPACRFEEKRALHSPRAFAFVDAVPPPISSSPPGERPVSKRQVPRSRWAPFRSSFMTSSPSSSSLPYSISEEQDTPSFRSVSTRLTRSVSSASPSLTIRRVLPSPPPKQFRSYDVNNGAYTCSNYQQQQQQQQQPQRHSSLRSTPSRGRSFRFASPIRGDIEAQNLESAGSLSETESELVTAVQGQVFAPGSASMVDVGGRRRMRSPRAGRDFPSVTASSGRTVKNVRSLPDLLGAAILLAQGGGRALTPSSPHGGEIMRSGSVRDTEPRRPNKLVRKRTLKEKGSRDLLQVPTR